MGVSFQAFLLYLYTNSIEFAPFGSEENRRSRSPEIAWTSEGEIPKPSPKSIYRLADKVSGPDPVPDLNINYFSQYDVPELKGTAFQTIQNGVQNCDIVQEAFSGFTSRCV